MIGGCVYVAAIWSIYAVTDLDRPVEKWGVFGDKFGALNTVFTGLAFVGLVATLWHQSLASAKDHYVSALVARIDGYTRQIDLYKGMPNVPQLKNEQDLLLWELADVLWEARKAAGGKVVTEHDRQIRQTDAAKLALLNEFLNRS